jgi:DNA-binding XRE family transcriptional regulator
MTHATVMAFTSPSLQLIQIGMNFSMYLRQLGRNIKAARKKSGLKQIDVNTCGISYRHYQSIEAGKVNVTIETLYRLANLYQIPISELVKHD